MNINMNDAFQMRQNGHARFRHDTTGEALAAARNDQIDIAVQAFQHQADSGTVGALYHLQSRIGQAGGAQALAHRSQDGGGGADGIRTAAQDRDIARL